jgi:hypothetical protein
VTPFSRGTGPAFARLWFTPSNHSFDRKSVTNYGAGCTAASVADFFWRRMILRPSHATGS